MPSKATLVAPAFLNVWSNKKLNRYYLNLNKYRNAHYILQNNAKKEFNRQMEKQLKALPKMALIHRITYTLIRTTSQSRDRNNVYCIVDKFFCDALQASGAIADDSDNFILDFNFTRAKYIRGKATDIRVEIEIIFDKK